VIKTIIVEGVDGAGKSTLVKELKNHLNWDSKSLVHKDGDQLFRYLKEYVTSDEVVLDRGHISEAIYSSFLNRKSNLDYNSVSLLDEIISNNAIIVFANPTLSLTIKRFQDRSNIYNKVDQNALERLHKLYQIWFKKHRYNNHVVTYASRNFKELDEIVKNIAGMVHDSNRA